MDARKRNQIVDSVEDLKKQRSAEQEAAETTTPDLGNPGGQSTLAHPQVANDQGIALPQVSLHSQAPVAKQGAVDVDQVGDARAAAQAAKDTIS